MRRVFVDTKVRIVLSVNDNTDLYAALRTCGISVNYKGADLVASAMTDYNIVADQPDPE